MIARPSADIAHSVVLRTAYSVSQISLQSYKILIMLTLTHLTTITATII